MQPSARTRLDEPFLVRASDVDGIGQGRILHCAIEQSQRSDRCFALHSLGGRSLLI